MTPSLWLIINDPDYWLVGRRRWTEHIAVCRAKGWHHLVAGDRR